VKTKQFKAESKRLLDMMINSIYTHKEIFLRELISNASDAMDKLYYHSLQNGTGGMNRGDFQIRIGIDSGSRTLTISDNGCGMTRDELEDNLGTIAKSGSLEFKRAIPDESEAEQAGNVDIIGQFGVGFYSAFMVSDEVTVESKASGQNEAFRWKSKGAEGYTVEPCEKESHGTTVILKVKEKTDDEDYDEFLDAYRIESIVKKYSDYIRYPIVMDQETRRLKEDSEDEYETAVETKTLNSMTPIWKKSKSEATEEEYQSFYQDKFYDYEKPVRIIRSSVEGQTTYTALLFIPKRAPYDYYTKDFKKGLQLYSSGVLIMDKCEDLLPDCFSFVKGLVDSEDLSLNISREMLQHDAQLKLIAKSLEKKIKGELQKLLKDEREVYEEFWKAFGAQIKYGVYEGFGARKDSLLDLLMFCSSAEKKLVTLEEYASRMKDGQTAVYYACGETADKIDMLPQVELVKDKGFEILYLTDHIDEFTVKMLREFDSKPFTNICADELDLGSDEDKEALKALNESGKELLSFMRESIGDAVQAVRFTNKLKNHPVCLTSEGEVSLEMEKVLNAMPMPDDNKVKARLALEINAGHPIADKLKEIFAADKEKTAAYAKILYAQARLIEGLTVDDPTELSNLVCGLMV